MKKKNIPSYPIKEDGYITEKAKQRYEEIMKTKKKGGKK